MDYVISNSFVFKINLVQLKQLRVWNNLKFSIKLFFEHKSVYCVKKIENYICYPCNPEKYIEKVTKDVDSNGEVKDENFKYLDKGANGV